MIVLVQRKVDRGESKDMSSGYGIKCEAETLPLLNSSYAGNVSSDAVDELNDMDLVGFLDVDDKSLSGTQTHTHTLASIVTSLCLALQS